MQPKLFDYLHVVSYLRDYYSYRKRANPGFSYENWARELGYKSKSYIRMVLLQKKRLTPGFEANFAKAENFGPREIEYWHFLIRYSHAKNQRDRQLFGRKLTQILSEVSGRREISEHFEFLSNPILPKLLVLLGFDDIAKTTEALAAILGASAPEVTMALSKLETLGLASNIEDNWQTTAKLFKVPDKLNEAALSSFHRASLEDAIAKLDSPPETRRYRSLLLPMNSEEMVELRELLEAFAADLTGRFRSDQYEQRRLFQMNFSLFPVTEPSGNELSPSLIPKKLL